MKFFLERQKTPVTFKSQIWEIKHEWATCKSFMISKSWQLNQGWALTIFDSHSTKEALIPHVRNNMT